MKQLQETREKIKEIRLNLENIEKNLSEILKDPELIEFYSPEKSKERRRQEANQRYYQKNKDKILKSRKK